MVKVLTLTGDEIEVNTDPNDTIQVLKEKLEERQGIAVDQQRLIYQGKKLKDENTLKSYKIIAGSILHLVVALRGGIPKLKSIFCYSSRGHFNF